MCKGLMDCCRHVYGTGTMVLVCKGLMDCCRHVYGTGRMAVMCKGLMNCCRHVYGTGRTALVRLEVERVGYVGTALSVSYATQDIPAAVEIAGMKVYNALGGADYNKAAGQLHFAAGVVRSTHLTNQSPGYVERNGSGVELWTLD